MNSQALKSQLERAITGARELAEHAHAAGRPFTPSEKRACDAHISEANSLRQKLKFAEHNETVDAFFGGLTQEPVAAPGGLTFSKGDLSQLHQAAVNGGQFRAKTITSTEGPMASIAEFVRDPLPFLRDTPRLLDRIPKVTVGAPSVSYYRTLTAASAAAAVAEGANKPESTPTWETVTANVRKIAHYSKITDEVLADFGNFLSVIGSELLAGLIYAETDQLLNGSGVAPNITGLLTTSGILTRARGTDTNVDAIEKAVTDLRTGSAFAEPDTIVLHPANFDTVRLLKDANGNYIAGDPFASGPVTLWGTPVVVTTRIASGTGMVANLQTAATAYVRMDPTLEVNTNGGEAEWKANLTLIRAEERLALAVARPTAIVKLTGLN